MNVYAVLRMLGQLFYALWFLSLCNICCFWLLVTYKCKFPLILRKTETDALVASLVGWSKAGRFGVSVRVREKESSLVASEPLFAAMEVILQNALSFHFVVTCNVI